MRLLTKPEIQRLRHMPAPVKCPDCGADALPGQPKYRERRTIVWAWACTTCGKQSEHRAESESIW